MALRSSTGAVGLGLVVFGVTSYAFLAVAARACGPERFAALSLLWIVTTTLGAGLFLPLEQELARFLADRRGRGLPGGAGLVTAAQGGALVLVLLTVPGLVALGPLTALFSGQGDVALAVLANLAGQALAYLSRGVAAGTGRFPLYGGQLALEGVLRVVSAVGLAVGGADTAAPYAFALAGSTVVSVLVAGPATRALLRDRGAPVVRAEVSRSFAWLVVAALASQALANSTPVLVSLLGRGSDAATAQFFAALLVARIPLFLFAAVQAALLPGLTSALAAGDVPGFRQSLRRVEVLVLAVGVTGIAGAALVGVPVVRLVFGDGFALGRSDLVLLALGTAIYLVANVQAQACLALAQHRRVAVAWVGGCLLGVAVALLPGDVLTRVEWAFVAGSALVLVVLASTAQSAQTRPVTTNSL